MSDSDTDWFDKDEETLVKDIKTKDNEEPNVEYIKCPPKVESTSKLHKRKSNTFPISTLRTISELDPISMFTRILEHDLEEMFNVSQNVNTTVLIVKILATLSEFDGPWLIKDLFNIFNDDHDMWDGILATIENFFPESKAKAIKRSSIRPIDVANNLLLIFKKIIIFKLHNEHFKKHMSQIKKLLDSFKLQSELEFFKESFTTIHEDLEYSPINNLNINDNEFLPTLEELKAENAVVLKQNIVEGEFGSVEEYLDIQKSLLREDFLGHLRTSLQKFKKTGKFESHSIVFHNVKILSSDDLDDSLSEGLTSEILLVDLHDLRDCTRPRQNLKERIGKLLYGDLLYFFTNADVDNLILAVVLDTDLKLLQEGYVHIEIIKRYNIGNVFNMKFSMLVSPVFFEAYRYAYDVLNSYNRRNFPMANYIVYIDKSITPPRYLTSSNVTYFFDNHKFNPFAINSYPDVLKDCLHGSQIDAFHSALTSEFSLIQGPPGTGKTELVTKLVKTLLVNTTLPIVIVAATNDGIDMLLLKIARYTNSIVRLGNQSKITELDVFNYQEAVKNEDEGGKHIKAISKFKEKIKKLFNELQTLEIDFDGSEDDYQRIIAAQEKLNNLRQSLHYLQMLKKYLIIKNIRIIALTTSAAARHHHMFQFLKDSIVIFEESAEILEAHVVTSITKYTQQLILVGDHYQLRPITSVYKLAKIYKMDCSLFERMINNKMNATCLDIQYRMRPEIADLIRPLIYERLEDGPNVSRYLNIRGMKSNLFFVTHTHTENIKTKTTRSSSNNFEINWLCKLATYLLNQEYSHSDIVMLTTYSSQRSALHLNINWEFKHLKGIVIETVDAFQGREANIVLLSLVRSNGQQEIGYLDDPNRICVALSRAKMGLYIVGNIQMLAEANSLWLNIKAKLESINAIGETLPLVDQ